MVDIKPILGVSQAAMGLAIAGENIKLIKKKQVKVKDIVKTGLTNVVGISLIKSVADISAGL